MSRKYIKANPLVAGYLGLKSVRFRLPDGNYALYYNDFQRLGRYGDYERLLEETGSIFLSGAEVAAEQKGGFPHSLPDATLPQFFVERPPMPEEDEATDPWNADPEETESEEEEAENIETDTDGDYLAGNPEPIVENPETTEDNDVTEQSSGNPVD